MGGKRYPQSLKERAFRVFYDTGSISEVVRVLKPQHKGVSKSTVSAWAKEPDATGKTWYERRNKIQAASHEYQDEEIGKDRRLMMADIEKFRKRLVDQLPTMEAKTLEGSAFAVTTLTKFKLEQSGADRNSEQTAKNAVTALLLALKDDPELADLIDRKWPEIEERFFKNLERIEKLEKKKK